MTMQEPQGEAQGGAAPRPDEQDEDPLTAILKDAEGCQARLKRRGDLTPQQLKTEITSNLYDLFLDLARHVKEVRDAHEGEIDRLWQTVEGEGTVLQPDDAAKLVELVAFSRDLIGYVRTLVPSTELSERLDRGEALAADVEKLVEEARIAGEDDDEDDDENDNEPPPAAAVTGAAP